MKNICITILLPAIAFFCVSNTNAQKAPIKFGNIFLDDLKKTSYAIDSSASAIILADYGRSKIDYGTDQFQVIFERTTRIKILKKDAYEWADHSIRIYNDGKGSAESVSSLKGFTYNYEGGRIEKTKLEKQSIFNEKIDDKWSQVKFTMPAVKEGSIIEFTYKVTSDFLFNYRGWDFQYTIPVILSEYRASFIEYYSYRTTHQGYLPMDVMDQSEGTQNFTIRYRAEVEPGYTGGRSPNRTSTVDARQTSHRWVMNDVPAFKVEPYTSAPSNYMSKVSFELESIKWPNKPIKYVRGTWEKINKQFLDYDFFWGKMKGSPFLKKELEGILVGNESDEEKIGKIHAYVTNRMTWNGYYSKYLENNLKIPFEEQKGSCAEINLLLTSLLKKAGLDADPVLVSTRRNGMVRTFNAVSSQFNYVICKVSLGENYLLLDATEPNLPPGVLPERCLNDKGYVISETNPGWVDLKPKFKKSSVVGGEVKISEDGLISGTLTHKLNGYSGYDERKKYIKKGEDEYMSEKKSNENWEIIDLNLENMNDYSKPLVLKYELEIEDNAEGLGDIIYLDPMISNKITKNPFTLEKREYPIDFSCPWDQTLYVTFELPEGYELEAPIAPLAIGLPDRAGRYTYSVTTKDNKIIVYSKLQIKKQVFVMNEYPYIKEFFAQIVAKQNEQLVIKKM